MYILIDTDTYSKLKKYHYFRPKYITSFQKSEFRYMDNYESLDGERAKEKMERLVRKRQKKRWECIPSWKSKLGSEESGEERGGKGENKRQRKKKRVHYKRGMFYSK